MSTLLKTAAVGIIVSLLPVAASAGTIDFKAAATVDERGFVDGTGETIDGYALKFYADSLSEDGYAYLDHGAGLGVCEYFNGSDATNGNEITDDADANECHTSGDDNLQAGESVTVEFEFAVNVDGLLFNKEGHGVIEGDLADAHNLVISTDIHAFSVMTFQEAMDASFDGITSITFDYGLIFLNDPGDLPYGMQYYVSAMNVENVPAPAALGLLGFGLLGLGGVRCRRRN